MRVISLKRLARLEEPFPSGMTLPRPVVRDEPPELVLSADTEREYRLWKKNAPFLYSYLSTSTLLWPSLTVQWFPEYELNPSQPHMRKQRMALGTYTGGQADDYLQLGNLHLINNASGSGLVALIEDWENNYDAQTEELVLTRGLDAIQPTKRLMLDITQRIKTTGEVNTLRIMPQNPDVIATLNNQGAVAVYNRTKHKSTAATVAAPGLQSYTFPSLDEEDQPVVRLDGHNHTEGWGLSWNHQIEGQLLSAAMDGSVNLWDLRRSYHPALAGPTSFAALQCHQLNAEGVNAVEWMNAHDSLFVAAGEDGRLTLVDTRQPVGRSQPASKPHHSTGVNSVSVNPQCNFLIASGDAEGGVAVWDTRMWTRGNLPVSHRAWKGHSDAVTKVAWNPSLGHVLASSSRDRTVKVWDASLADITVPMFVHAGHLLGVNDFDWNTNDEWMIASVADDNSLHVWRPTEAIQELT